MVHKKFLKVGNKIYGPYYYESYRENGKVKKRYINSKVFDSYEKKEEQKKNKYCRVKNFLLILGLFFILIIIFVLFLKSNYIQLSPEFNQQSGLTLSNLDFNNEFVLGQINLSLRKGELLPINSTLKINHNDQVTTFFLSDFIKPNAYGDYYLDKKNVQGKGDGYGFKGFVILYPNVSFELLLFDENKENLNEKSIDQEKNSKSDFSEKLSEELDEPSNDTLQKSQQVDNQEEYYLENNEESSLESKTEEISLSPNEIIIKGQTSLENPFSYKNDYNFSARIVEGSVKTEDKKLDESVLVLEKKEREIMVYTNYTEIREGFGKDFLQDEYVSFLIINLSDFKIKSSGIPNLSVSLEYMGEELYKAQVIAKQQNDTIQNLSIIKEIGIINITKGVPHILNLNEYFYGADKYSTSESENFELSINESILTINLKENFSGLETIEVFAFSKDANISQNMVLYTLNQSLVITKQYKAVINRPVKWVKVARFSDFENATVNIPKEAYNINLKFDQDEIENLIIDAEKEPINDEERKKIISQKGDNLTFKTSSFKTKFYSSFYSQGLSQAYLELENESIINFSKLPQIKNETEVAVEYFTDAPSSKEFGVYTHKKVIISGPDELNYTDILAYTLLNNIINISEAYDKIEVRWLINDSESYHFEPVNFTAFDLDEDGFVDYLEWIVPHLSTQVYEVSLFRGDIFADAQEGTDVHGNVAHLKLTKEGGTFKYLEKLRSAPYSTFINTGINFANLTNKSISVWVRPRKCGNYRAIMSESSAWDSRKTSGLYVYNSDRDIGFCYPAFIQAFNISGGACGSAGKLTNIHFSGDNLRKNDWNHVVVTFDVTSGASIYVNGKFNIRIVSVYCPDSNFPINFALLNNPLFYNYTLYKEPQNKLNFFAGGGYSYEGDIDEAMVFNRTLSDSEVLALYQYNRGYNKNVNIPQEGLIGWWEFDEQSGSSITNKVNNQQSTYNGNPSELVWRSSFSIGDRIAAYYPFDGDDSYTIYDFTDNNFNGNYYGNINISSSFCKYGPCADFKGNGYAQIENSFYLSNLVNFTYSLWLRLSSATLNEQTLFSAGRNNFWAGLIKDGASYDFKLFWNASSPIDFNCDLNIQPGGLQNLVLASRHNQGILNLTLYYNNELKCTQSFSILGFPSNQNPFTIAGHSSQGNFDGRIDDLMIFNSTLNSEEVSLLYHGKAVRFVNKGIQYIKQFNIEPGKESIEVNLSGVYIPQDSYVGVTLYEWNQNKSYTFTDLGEDPSLKINGSSSYVELNRFLNVSLGDTLSFWVYIDNHDCKSGTNPLYCDPSSSGSFTYRKYSSDAVILGSNESDSNLRRYLKFWKTPGAEYIEIKDNSREVTSASYDVIPSFEKEWHFYTIVFSSLGTYIYKDGYLATIFQQLQNNINLNQIGAVGNPTNQKWQINGSIDELMLFNSILSEEDILGLYHVGRNPPLDYLRTLNIKNRFSFDRNFSDDIGNLVGTVRGQFAFISPDKNNLISYFTADNHSNDVISSNNAIFTGPLYSNGVYGRSFLLNGSNYLTIPDNQQRLGFTNKNFTISFWLKSLEKNRNQTIISKSLDKEYSNYKIQIDSNNIISFYFTDFRLLGPTIEDENWTHIIISYDYSLRKPMIYLNGFLYNQSVYTQSSPSSNDQNVMIGCDYDTSEKFNGTLDEIMFFNRTLSESEIRDLYTRGRANWFVNKKFQNYSDSVLFRISPSATNILPVLYLNSDSNGFFSPMIDISGKAQKSKFVAGDVHAPIIEFIYPSPLDGEKIGADSVIINIHSTDSNDHFVFLDFDNKTSFWLNAENFGEDNIGDVLGKKVGQVSPIVTQSIGKFGKAFNLTDGGNITIFSQNLGISQSFFLKTQDSEWMHIVNNSGVLYVNGIQNNSAIVPIFESGEDLIIGNFNGLIDEIIVFDRNLTISEILSLNSSRLNQYFSNFSDLLNRQYNITAYAEDSSGNINSISRSFFVNKLYPIINFVSPTSKPFSRDFAILNVSIDDSSDTMAFLDFDNSLVSWWDMDNIKYVGGKMVLVDYKGINNCTVSKFAEQTIDSKYGKAIRFTKGLSVFDCGKHPSLRISNNITIAFWYKQKNYSETWIYQDIIKRTYSYTINNEYFYRTNFILNIGGSNYGEITSDIGRIRIYTSNTSDKIIQNNNVNALANEDTWYHVVWTYDYNSNPSSKVYINGVLNHTSNNAKYPLYSGPDGSLILQGDNNLLDELMIFNRTLTDKEVRALYGGFNNSLFYNRSGMNHGDTFYYQAIAKNSVGNTNRSFIGNITIDKAPPEISLLSPVSGVPYGSEVFVNVTVQDNYDSNGECNYSLDEGEWKAINQTSRPIPSFSRYDSKIDFSFDDPLAHRLHKLNVSCSDTAGNNNSVGVIFNVSLFSLSFLVSAPTQANTTTTINISGQINRTNGTQNWPISDNLFFIKLNEKVVSSGETSDYFTGNFTNLSNVSNSLILNMIPSQIFNYSSDNYQSEPQIGEKNLINKSNIGFSTGYLFSPFSNMNPWEGFVIYKYTSPTLFSFFLINVTSFSPLGNYGGSSCVSTSTNGTSWTLRGCLSSGGSLQYITYPNSSEFYVKINSTKGGSYTVPIVRYIINYSSYNYTSFGEYVSKEIYGPSARFNHIKLFKNENLGNITIQLRDKKRIKISNSSVAVKFDNPNTNIVAPTGINLGLPIGDLSNQSYFFNSTAGYFKINNAVSSNQFILNQSVSGINIGDPFQVINESWNPWSRNITENYEADIFSLLSEDTVQYKINVLRGPKSDLSPNITNVFVGYINSRTNQTGHFQNQIYIPSSVNIGTNTLKIEVFNSSHGVTGSQSRTISVYANTYLSYFKNLSFSGEKTNFSLGVFINRSDNNQVAIGNIKVDVLDEYNQTVSTQSCNSKSFCLFNWLISNSGGVNTIGKGNYTFNISTFNQNNFLNSEPINFKEYLEEVNTTGLIQINDTIISDYVWGSENNYTIDVLVLNTGYASMHNVSVNMYNPNPSIKRLVQASKCDVVLPGESCVVKVNLSIFVNSVDEIRVNWIANWTNNNGQVSVGNCPSFINQGLCVHNVSSIIIESNSKLISDIINLRDTIEHGQKKQYTIKLLSIGSQSVEGIIPSIEGEIKDWTEIDPSEIFLLPINQEANISMNISVPIHTSPGSYEGTLKIKSNSKDGDINISINISVPSRRTWKVEEQDYTYNNVFGLNTNGNIANITINNTGNEDLLLKINYFIEYNGINLGDIAYETNYNFMSYNKNIGSLVANPSSIFVEKGKTEVVRLYSNNLRNAYSDVVVIARIENSTSDPYLSDYRDSFSVVEQPPKIEAVLFYDGNKLIETPELSRDFTLKIVASDDNNLEDDPAYANLTLDELTIYSGPIEFIRSESPQNQYGAYPRVNYSRVFKLDNRGDYNLSVFINDSIGNTDTKTISFSPVEETNLEISLLSSSNIEVNGIDKYNSRSVVASIRLNNTGLAYAYNPSLSINPSSYPTINWSYIPFSNISSKESSGKVLNINVSGMTPSGIYPINIKARWNNPNGNLVYSQGQVNIILNVTETESIEVPNNLNIIMDSSYKEFDFLVNNSGNTNLSEISIRCEGTAETPEFCSIFNVVFNNSDFDLLFNHSASVKVTLSTNDLLGQGEYVGKLVVYNQELSRDINLIVSIPQVWTWSYSPKTITSTKGVGQFGLLEKITINNTGNQDITFSINSSNSSIIIPELNSIFVPARSSREFNVSFNASEEKVYNENITIRSPTANPPNASIPIRLTSTNIKVNVLYPTQSQPLQSVLPGDIIQVHANATYNNVEIKSNSQWEIYVGSARCKDEFSVYDGEKWVIYCKVPNLPDGKIYDLIAKIDYENGAYGKIEGISQNSVDYKDITPPIFLKINRNNINKNQEINLSALIYDNFDVAYVLAKVTYPNGSSFDCVLSREQGNTWVCKNYILDMAGEYIVNYTAYDYSLNLASYVDWFEVYEEFDWYLDFFDFSYLPVRNVSITLYRPNETTKLSEGQADSLGRVFMKVNQRVYDMSIKFDKDEIFIREVDFRDPDNKINISGYRLNKTEIREMLPIMANPGIPYAALVINQSGLENNSVFVIFDYSAYYNSLPRDESYFKVIKCLTWNYTGKYCINQSWEILQSNVVRSNKQVISNSTGFSAFFLTLNSCGDGACDSIYGETASSCPIDCIVPSSNVGQGASSLGGGGGGGSLKETINNSDISKIVSSIKTINGVRVDTSSIYKEMYPGDSTYVKVILKNTLNATNKINLNVSGYSSSFVDTLNKFVEFGPNEMKEVLFNIKVPKDARAGLYDGSILIFSQNESFEIPLSIKVLSIEEKLVEVKISSLRKYVSPGNILEVQVDLLNLGKSRNIPVRLEIHLIELNSGTIIYRHQEEINLTSSHSSIRSIRIPNYARRGDYIIKAMAYYSENSIPSTSISYFSVRYPILSIVIFGIQLWVYLVAFSFILFISGIYGFFAYKKYKNKRFKLRVELSKLPKSGPNSAYVGKVAETGTKAYLELNKLQMHTLIAGMTGSGKTVAAQDIVEEALLHNKSVIVFDPTAQWTGFLRKCEDQNLLRRYKYFDMNIKDARAFNGSIKTINNPYEIIDISKYLNRPGEITIFNVSNLDPKDMDIVVASTIQQIFRSHPEESKELKALIVYDEVHRLLPKFGGSGQGFIQIERGAREFRKWGIGLLLISQVLSDFVGEIKANIGTEIQMGTRYEGDLERVSMKYGDEVLKSVVKEPIGTGMVVNAEHNSGRPYFIAFRPLLHSTKRLSDGELKKYEEYFDTIEDIEYQISELKKLNVDVLDIELELKLMRNKVKEGQFQMAEMYMDSLLPLLERTWKKIGKRQVHKPKELIKKEEITQGIKEAKVERERYINKNPQSQVSLKEEILNIKKQIEQKKLVGKQTSKVEMRLQDFINRLKGQKNINQDDLKEIIKEIKEIKKEIQDL